MLAFRENDIAQIRPTIQLPSVPIQKQISTHPVHPPLGNSTSPRPDLPPTSTSRHDNLTTSTTKSDEFSLKNPDLPDKCISMTSSDDHHPMPGSETDYWFGMEDMSMEDEPQPDIPAVIGPVPATAPSFALPTRNLKESLYYSEIVQQLTNVFGLTNFRPNQLEAITETLAGRDVFVLMPTGGGKSLCYQLPAVCKSGKTKGVTVVISPLLALMKDQVYALTEKNINVFLWNSEASWDEAMHRMRAGTKPSLMYITPEKLRESNAAQGILMELYRKKELARFVVDEAHCISTWGQDFRDAVSFI